MSQYDYSMHPLGNKRRLARSRVLLTLSILLTVGLVVSVAVVARGGKPQSRSTASKPKAKASTLQETQFKGIIVGSTNGLNRWTLSAYDPDKGLVATRTFSYDDFGTAPTGGPRLHGEIARQLFSADYTKMAVYELADDGTQSIGYINEAGTFTNLTPPKTDYSTVQKQTYPLFNPVTGRIWFNTPSKIGSVDPKAGPSSSRNEPFDTYYHHNGLLDKREMSSFYFAPNGSTPLDTKPDILWDYDYFIYSPDNKSKVQYVLGGLGPNGVDRVGGGFKVNGSMLTPFPRRTSYCKLQRFIHNTTFLCLSDKETQLYKMTVQNNLAATAGPLLPESERKVSDSVGGPHGNQVAFIASSGDVSSLYVIDSKGGQPQKVADVGDTSVLLSWED